MAQYYVERLGDVIYNDMCSISATTKNVPKNLLKHSFHLRPEDLYCTVVEFYERTTKIIDPIKIFPSRNFHGLLTACMWVYLKLQDVGKHNNVKSHLRRCGGTPDSPFHKA